MIPNTSDRPIGRTDDDRRRPDRASVAPGTVAVLAAILLVVAAPLVAGVAVADHGGGGDAPSVPASYYGDVTINGDPAAAGTEITAMVNGEPHGSIETAEEGAYGGPGALDEKLVVEGAEPNDTVSFEVRGVEAEETVEWESGDVQEVDLTFEGVPESSGGDGSGQTTASGGSGGGGGGGAAPAPGSGTETPSSDTTGTDVTTPGPGGEIDGVADVSGIEVVSQSQANISTDPGTDAPRATFDGDSPVRKVEFDSSSGGSEATTGSVEVSEVSAPPAETGDPPGSATTVTAIQVPDGMKDTAATVEMRVSDARLAELDATAEDLRIHRYHDGEWQALETRVVEESGNGVVLAADTPGFSFFAASAVGKPDAELRLSADTVDPATTVTLDGTGSEDPYGEIVAYNWSVAGEDLTGETASLALDEPGEYTVELAVTNDAGATDTATATLVVSEPDSGGSSQETAAEVTGNGAGDAGSNGTVERETFGAVPPVWLLGLGAVLVAVVLGLTVVLRRDDSSQERL